MKLKLLYLPRFCRDFEALKNESSEEQVGGIHLPPIGIASLTSFLERGGVSVSQDDLMIKSFYHNISHKDRIDLEKFCNRKRINKFIETGTDPGLEREGEKILDLTDCRGFDVIGFSIYEPVNPSAAGVALVLGKLLKEKHGATILLGGRIPKEVLSYILKTDFVDSGIVERAENKLLKFCKLFERGFKLEDIPGTVHASREGGLIEHPSKEEKTPFVRPSFEGLPLNLYRQELVGDLGGKRKYEMLVLPYYFIRGCPNRCAFCRRSLDPNWEGKDPEKVAEDLEILSEKYDTDYFFFLNPEINPTYSYAERVAEELINSKINIHWSDCAQFNNLDEELLKKLKDAGATRLVFGIESASPKLLNYVNKPIQSPEKARKILKDSYRLGIWNKIDFICGFPHEREKDIRLTIDFIEENGKYIQDADVSKFRPGGLMEKNPEKYGIKILEKSPEVSRDEHLLPFEEIDGLDWERKVVQINRFHERIWEKLKPLVTENPTPNLNQMERDEREFMHFVTWWAAEDKGWEREDGLFKPNPLFERRGSIW